jgi:hypothetical protein
MSFTAPFDPSDRNDETMRVICDDRSVGALLCPRLRLLSFSRAAQRFGDVT